MKKIKDKAPWIVIILIIGIMAIPFFTRNDDNTLVEGQTPSEIPLDEQTAPDDEDITTTSKGRGVPKDAIGIIEIDSLDIQYPIYEGATEAQLSKGIGHLPETAGLLEKGNCVLCGHNGSSRGLFFTTLSHIRKGAQVKITTKDKRSRIYCVKSTRVVSPHDPSVRKKNENEILTLFTCAYHGTRRFVATCVPQIDETPAPSLPGGTATTFPNDTSNSASAAQSA